MSLRIIQAYACGFPPAAPPQLRHQFPGVYEHLPMRPPSSLLALCPVGLEPRVWLLALAGLLWPHGSGAPWVHARGQPRAAGRASLLPGRVLDFGRLCPRLPGRDSSVPTSHQASRSGILSSCGPLSPAAISTRGPGRSHAALGGFQTHRTPGSPSLCRPFSPRPLDQEQRPRPLPHSVCSHSVWMAPRRMPEFPIFDQATF